MSVGNADSGPATVPLSQLVGSTGSTAGRHTLVVVQDGKVVTYSLDGRGSVTIGRSSSADLTIDDPGLSREHARLDLGGARCMLRDLGSRNGTFIEGARLVADVATPLAAEVVVALGTTRLMLQSQRGVVDAAVGPRSAAFATVRRVAMSDLNVLLVGERGTGKRTAARALHGSSRRAAARLHVHDLREGLAWPSVAEGSTLVLRGLQSLDRLGQLRVDEALAALEGVRVVGCCTSGTAEPLPQQEALFDRVGQVRIHLPPVRGMGEDLPTVAADLLESVATRLGLARTPELSEAALRVIAAQAWPGNLSELMAALERAVVDGDGATLALDHLVCDPGSSLSPAEQAERRRIVAALDDCVGNQTRAAKQLGISRGTLVSRLRKYGIRRPRT